MYSKAGLLFLLRCFEGFTKNGRLEYRRCHFGFHIFCGSGVWSTNVRRFVWEFHQKPWLLDVQYLCTVSTSWTNATLKWGNPEIGNPLVDI